MEKVIRQCVGIDVSKDTLDAALGYLHEDFKVEVYATSQFENNVKGFKQLMGWMKKLKHRDFPCQVVVEATGVYHESLVYTLAKGCFEIAVVLPNKIRNYCRSTNIRTVTDKISARQIAEFGLVKRLENWVPPDNEILYLKGLCRERIQLLQEKTIATNRKHSHDYSILATKGTTQRSKKRISFIEKQISEIEQEVKETINNNPWLKKKIENICTLKGVGMITAVTIIAETNGFNLIRNARQLVCYAGYDVVVKESGTSVRSKSKISHKGNKYIRRALHFPAISAVGCDHSFSAFYTRLFERQKIKMKTYVAVQRKLLILIYTLWKTDQAYDPLYQHNSQIFLEQPNEAALTELVLDRS